MSLPRTAVAFSITCTIFVFPIIRWVGSIHFLSFKICYKNFNKLSETLFRIIHKVNPTYINNVSFKNFKFGIIETHTAKNIFIFVIVFNSYDHLLLLSVFSIFNYTDLKVMKNAHVCNGKLKKATTFSVSLSNSSHLFLFGRRICFARNDSFNFKGTFLLRFVVGPHLYFGYDTNGNQLNSPKHHKQG